MLYILLSLFITVFLAFPIFKVFKIYLERKFYERQGVSFVRTFPIFGSEVAITDLINKNKTRDYLYADGESTNFIGSIRGFDIQLYSTDRETTEELIKPSNIGVYIDRDTPALYSFGQLSPSALTFTPIRSERFHERKVSILKSFDIKRMDEISKRRAREYSRKYIETNILDMKQIASDWTRDVMGEFVWGCEAMNKKILYKDAYGRILQVSFMLALNKTFTRLRYYSNRFWNRVYFPIATWPITKEARLLQYNIRRIQEHLAIELREEAAPNSVAYHVIIAHGEFKMPLHVIRDDLLTVSIAGLDTVQSTILASLWYILLPENNKWKQAILTSSDSNKEETVKACINEAIRLDPPGSVINNRVIKDFEIETSGKKYLLRKGTRIMPNIHALHVKYGYVFQPERFLEAKSKNDSYVMPFGKGRRSCPGQTIGMLMAINYVREFITKNPTAYIMNTEDEHIHFNNLSRSKLMIGLHRDSREKFMHDKGIEESVCNRNSQRKNTTADAV